MKLNVIASFVYITSAFLRLDSGSIHISIYSHIRLFAHLVCLVLVWRKYCVWIFQGNSKTEPFFYSMFVARVDVFSMFSDVSAARPRQC